MAQIIEEEKQGWESKLRRILQNVNKHRHLGTKNVCFC
jgi:hypothetical protein